MDEKEIEEFRTNLAARLERVPPEQRRACMEAILSKIRVIKAEAQRERIAREKWQRERDETREKS